MPPSTNRARRPEGPVTTSAPAAPPSPAQFSFVTATNPDQFRNRETMRTVRRQAMHTYLDKAGADPTSTDIRVTKRRTQQPNRTDVTAGPSLIRQSTDEQDLAIPSPRSGHAETGRSRTHSRQQQHQRTASEDACSYFPDPIHSISTPLSSTDSSISNPHLSDQKLVRRFPPPPPPAVAATAVPVSSPITDSSSNTGSSIGSEALTFNLPVRTREKRLSYDVAYSRPYGLHLREVTPDPFASCSRLENESINVELLKYNCTAYFATYGLAKLWVPLLLTSPAAFLSSLCISAPYSDMMAVQHRGSRRGTLPIERQTMEILDVVPSIINASLTASGPTDSNITAITQLLSGSLAGDYTSFIIAHQAITKSMIQDRGGLRKLESTILPVIVAISNMNASLFRDEKADDMYTEYVSSWADRNPRLRRIVPESPLFSRNGLMTSVSTSKSCSTGSLQLINLTARLTEKFLALGRLEERLQAPVGPAIPAGEPDEATLRDEIESLVIAIHELPAAHMRDHSAHNDHYYEAIRLASLLYAHAIWSRVPLHVAHTIPCPVEHHGGSCIATPAMIQRAVQRTNMSEMWDRMAGTLHWVLMVGGIACHTPVVATLSEGNSPRDDQNEESPAMTRMRPRKTSLNAIADTPTLNRSSSAPAWDHTFSLRGQKKPMLLTPTSSEVMARVRNTVPDASPGAAVARSSERMLVQAIHDLRAAGGTPSAQQMWALQSDPRGSLASTSLLQQQQQQQQQQQNIVLSGSQRIDSLFETTPSHTALYSALSSSNLPPMIEYSETTNMPYSQGDTYGDDQPMVYSEGSGTVQQPMASSSRQQEKQQQQRPIASSSANTSSSRRVRQSGTQQAKRTRPTDSSSPRLLLSGGGVAGSVQASVEDDEKAYVRKYLVGNAVRACILLQFEHTAPVIKALVAMGRVRGYLVPNARN